MAKINIEKALMELNLKADKDLTPNERLKKLRYMMGESQEQFAEGADIDVSSLKKYEGTRIPQGENLRKIAEHCKVSTEYILTGNSYEAISEVALKEFTGLDAESFLVLQNIKNNRVSISVLNELIHSGMISKLIDLTVSFIKYVGIYNAINNVDEKLSASIDKQVEFAKWDKINKLSSMITDTSKKIAELLPDEFTQDDFEEHEEIATDISLLMDIIEDKLNLFKKYES